MLRGIVAVLFWHHRKGFVGRRVVCDRNAGWRDQINAVRLAIDAFIDPAELEFEGIQHYDLLRQERPYHLLWTLRPPRRGSV